MKVDISSFNALDPIPALYSSPEGEERVMMIASDVSRSLFKHNVVLIKRADDSELVVAEGHLNPIKPFEDDARPVEVYVAELAEFDRANPPQHLDECTCDDCYADLDVATQDEVDAHAQQVWESKYNNDNL
jgi:hypothetical protein